MQCLVQFWYVSVEVSWSFVVILVHFPNIRTLLAPFTVLVNFCVIYSTFGMLVQFFLISAVLGCFHLLVVLVHIVFFISVFMFCCTFLCKYIFNLSMHFRC